MIPIEDAILVRVPFYNWHRLGKGLHYTVERFVEKFSTVERPSEEPPTGALHSPINYVRRCVFNRRLAQQRQSATFKRSPATVFCGSAFVEQLETSDGCLVRVGAGVVAVIRRDATSMHRPSVWRGEFVRSSTVQEGCNVNRGFPRSPVSCHPLGRSLVRKLRLWSGHFRRGRCWPPA